MWSVSTAGEQGQIMQEGHEEVAVYVAIRWRRCYRLSSAIGCIAHIYLALAMLFSRCFGRLQLRAK